MTERIYCGGGIGILCTRTQHVVNGQERVTYRAEAVRMSSVEEAPEREAEDELPRERLPLWKGAGL